MIGLRDVHVVLGQGERRTEVHAPDLGVDAGEIACLSGRNGSGKTTLLRVIGGSIKPRAGLIKAARPLIAFMDMERQFHLRMTAEENFRWVGRMFGLPKADHRIRAEAFEQAGLSAHRKSLVGEFSKGQKARLALSVLMGHKARSILLDEPTNGLDAEGRELAVEVLRRVQQQGSAICITSHDIAFIRALDMRVFAPDADNRFHEISGPVQQTSHRVMKVELTDGTEAQISERDLPAYLEKHAGQVASVTAVGVSFQHCEGGSHD